MVCVVSKRIWLLVTLETSEKQVRNLTMVENSLVH